MIPALAAAEGAKSIMPKSEVVKTIITLAIVIAVLWIVYMVVKRVFGGIDGLFQGLGLQDSPEKKRLAESVDKGIEDSNNSNSPWNPAFYKTAPPGSRLLTTAATDNLASQVWSSVGVISDTPTQATGAIKQCPSQAAVSFLASRFQTKYGRDLVNWMREHFDTESQVREMNTILAYVANLPKY